MNYRTRTTYSTDVDDVEVELQFQPCDWMDMHKVKVGNKLVVAYNVLDDDFRSVDDLMGDCMGSIVDAYNGRDADRRELYELAGYDRYGDKDLDAVWDKHEDEAIRRYIKRLMTTYSVNELREGIDDEEVIEAPEIEDWLRQDAHGADWGNVAYEKDMQAVLDDMWDEPAYWPGNPDAVFLDVYDHSGQCWSISGGGMQCRWDTSSGAGAWVPDKCLLEQIESDVKEGKDRRTQCRHYAKQFLDTYNDIISGNIYGCVVQTHDLDGELIDEDSCWGFIGSEYAEQSLLDEFFDPMVSKLTKEWEDTHEQA